MHEFNTLHDANLAPACAGPISPIQQCDVPTVSIDALNATFGPPCWDALARSLRGVSAPAKQKHAPKLVASNPAGMWLVDIGCGHDLISKTVAAQRSRYIRKGGAPIRFSTANGTTNLTTTILPLSFKELGEVIEPYILDSTPPVITVGRRCMHSEYTFIWPSGTPPILHHAQFRCPRTRGGG